MSSFSTKTTHKTPYPALSPTLPQHSQAGQTVVITGGGSGIGFAITRAFVQAGAAKIIILGRRAGVLSEAIAKLQKEVPNFKGELQAVPCDISDAASVTAFWDGLEKAKTAVDVLVLNAAIVGYMGDIAATGNSNVWAAYESNVQANLRFAQLFFGNVDAVPNGRKKALIEISTIQVRDYSMPHMVAYGATKTAFTTLFQRIATQVPVEKVQMVSIDPGFIPTPGSLNALGGGHNIDSSLWDDVNLAGQFVVWATTPAATAFHGRFVEAHWDIEELQSAEVKERLANESKLLLLGVNGI
ncbi:hypothetical protein AJ79_03727 [Helicocarpus griseus UAMH5409]|uniref:Oxidoreductase n=1 Tax=Helicocarpus griseus UAMH5409 TaxID=1447875 RepID=A0A2B7XX14_9EURO|nr:hypothetical protein AJ79_03727 [Helicocarpus griseus UAMH5409]